MGDENIKVSIIIPHYNQKDCLEGLFPNLVDQTYKDFEVILIDDCTPDKATIDFVRDFIKDKPNMQLVQNEVNMRFVKTVNKGITLAKGDYICLLNSDTALDKTFVQRNVEILDADPTIGGLTCTIVDKSGQIWFSGGCYNKGFPINLKDDFEGIRQVDFIAGTAAFYRRDVFKKIGLFDERYIMYHEDVEYGLRIKKLTDYQLCNFSDKLVIHLIISSIPKIDVYYYDDRNRIMLSKKYALKYLPILIGNIVWNCITLLISAFLKMLARKHLISIFKVRLAYTRFKAVIVGLMAHQTQYACIDIAKPC